MITWLCACMRMWKSAKNDNSIHESDWQERTLLYRYISRETEEKIENFANKKKARFITYLWMSEKTYLPLICENSYSFLIDIFFWYIPR